LLRKGAFENAMTLDIAMGGSTNTVLHILAAAHEGEIDFDQDDIDALSRNVPVLCKVAPAKADVHMEDVHRAGGIMAILGQLDGAGLINRDLPTVHTRTLGEAIDHWDISRTSSQSVRDFFLAAPGGVPTQIAFSQDRRWTSSISTARRALSGQSSIPFPRWRPCRAEGNLALDGCIVKTAGVDESILKFTGPARVFESQDSSVKAILGNEIKAGDVVVIRYEGPRGAPACRKCSTRPAISSRKASQSLRAGHRRPLLRRHVGPVDRPRFA